MSFEPSRGAIAEPDFAFPQQVADSATAQLAQADAMAPDEASLVRLRAMLELTVARTEVDPDSVYVLPAQVGAQAAKANNSPSGRAMLLALEASLLTRIYNSDSWAIDRVDTPLRPVPENVRLWSRDQFAARTAELLDSALARDCSERLSFFAPAVSDDATAEAYGLTAGDFIRRLAVENAKTFSNTVRADSLTQAGVDSAPAGSPRRMFWLYVATEGNPAKRLEYYLENKELESARLLLSGLDGDEMEETDGDDGNPQLVSAGEIRLVGLLRESLQRFPNWVGNSLLTQTLKGITCPQMQLTAPPLSAPGRQIKLTVRYAFAETIVVNVYHLPDNYQSGTSDYGPLVRAMTVEPASEVGETEIDFLAERTGRYIFVPKLDNANQANTVEMVVTPVVPFTIGCGPTQYAATASSTNGAPAGGVGIDLVTTAFRTGTSHTSRLGRTDRKGLLALNIPEADRANQSLVFTIEGHRLDFDRDFGVSAYSAPRANRSTNAVVMTDRALYHPGDSLEWALVAYSRNDAAGNVLAEKKLTVAFLDANNETIATSEVTTDRLGRAEGTFAVPTGRLTGEYDLRVSYRDNNIAYRSVTVSDFKLPTVRIEDIAVSRDEPTQGAVTIRGLVRTYSGMAVGGATVSAEVSRARRWWWFFAPEEEVGTIEATTDADGNFALVAPASLLTPGEDGSRNFTAEITATTLNAETAQATTNFTTGKPLQLAAEFPRQADGATETTARILAYNAAGEQQSVAVRWSLQTIGGAEAGGGTAVAGERFSLPLAGVPVGYYTVKAWTSDSALADTLTVDNTLAVYNTATNSVPDGECPYFIPDGSVERRAAAVSVNVGINKASATVYLAVRGATGLLAIKPFTLRRGFHKVNVELPASSEPQSVQVVAVYDCRSYTNEYAIPQPQPEQLKISAESFRDRLVPGDTETWRLHIGKGDVAAAGAGMIATMFNGALEALESYSTPQPVVLRGPQAYLRLNTLSYYPRTAVVRVRVDRASDIWYFSMPEWRFMDRLAVYVGGVLMEGNMKMMSRASANVTMYDEGADLALPAGASTDSEEESAAPSAERSVPEVEYRTGDVLQAFFMPRLTADAEGNVDLVFTVPNANGAWALRAFGWTADMASASYSGEAVSSKPVMVQPNLPRFLRQGDVARLGATVFNNTDSTASVSTTVEIFNPTTGAVVSRQTFEDRITAGASAIVAVEAAAPTDGAAVGYRVRAVSGRFADGEQTAVPVLPSEGTVVESTEFYLNPTQEPYIAEIEVQPETSYTLQYVSNPVWTVVKALRGVSGGGNTSPAIVSRLYSTLAALRIAQSCPNIASAYREWASHPSDSALVSMLGRNSELKTLLLDQTPWVQACASQSDRMAELGRIFDGDAVASSLSRSTSALTNLAGANGGIAWGPWSTEPSEWATRTVLTTLGLANSMEMLGGEDELIELARNAYNYLQGEVAKPHRPETDQEFALISSLFPDFDRTEATQSLISRTVASLASGWRSLSTTDKAYAVIVLKANGKGAVASRVAESLLQFGVVRAGQGMCFPSVSDIRSYATIIQAFAEMGLDRSTMDAMRQWITVQAQATDNLGAYNPDYVIASVLLTGSDWTAAPQAFAVLVDGTPLESSALERATGYTAARLTPSGSTLRIEVRPNGATPSYGSVTSVGRRTLATVQARPGRDLAIGKRFLVSRGGEWVETDSFALGERVRVQLILEAGRAMQYVAITDLRAATLEPVEQLPGYVYDGSLGFYRENGDSETRLFIDWLPAGTYHITYDMTANNAGRFSSGTATVQSQYAPELTAHSGGTMITVR